MTDNQASYFIIHNFMRYKLGLKGTALIIYAIIYSFSHDGVGVFHGSREYLADFSGVSVSTASRILKELAYSELIAVVHGKNYEHKYYRVNLEKLKDTEEKDINNVENRFGKEKKTPFGESKCANQNELPTNQNDLLRVSNLPPAHVKMTCNNKDNNKEIIKTTSTTTARESEFNFYFLEEENRRRRKRYEKELARYGDKKGDVISDMYREGIEETRQNGMKYELAREYSGKLEFDETYFDVFKYYGKERLVLMSRNQYGYLLTWLGEEVLNTYIAKLEDFIINTPGEKTHSHFSLIKKWAKSDFALA